MFLSYKELVYNSIFLSLPQEEESDWQLISRKYWKNLTFGAQVQMMMETYVLMPVVAIIGN